MKNLLLIPILFLSITPITHARAIDMNQLVLEAVNEMPSEGGYELTGVPPQRMADAFVLQPSGLLDLDPFQAIPSYCTTATYMVFYKVLQKYWEATSAKPSTDLLTKIRPNLESDGERIWGRWNSNGPGTAKFFYETKLGTNFDEIKMALPGDFIKIFWNDFVGKSERGHTGIFLGIKKINGEEMLHFWASSKSTNGFAERMVLLAEAKRILISRFNKPENYQNIENLPELDSFLASMLVRESNWKELRAVSGF